MTASQSAINPPAKRRLLSYFLYLLSLGLFAFAVWIIYRAGTGQSNALLKWVKETPYADKIGHLFLSGAIATAANWLLRLRCLWLKSFPIPWGSLIVLIAFTLEEGSQAFIVYRSFDLYDAAMNTLGIVLAALPLILWKRKERGGLSQSLLR